MESKCLPLDERERLLKAYHATSADPAARTAFLSSFDPRVYPASECFIPELNPIGPARFTEQSVFSLPDSNVTITRHLRYTPFFTHDHTVFELAYVLSGSCIQLFDGKKHRMEEGDLMLITPGVAHALGVFDDDSIVYNILIKRSTFEETFFRLLSKDNLLSDYFSSILCGNLSCSFLLFHTKNDPNCTSLFHRLIEEGEQSDDYSPLCIENLLMLLFSALLRRHTEAVESAGPLGFSHVLLPRILAYLRANFKTASLTDCAARLACSPAHLSRTVRSETGMTFSDILLDIKFNHAATLLKNTDYPISQIAAEIGYFGVEQFYHMFKKRTGLTPGAFRKENKTKV